METYLCACNNCGTILIDHNPSTDAKSVNIGLAVINRLQELVNFECPVCKTDNYLTDDWLSVTNWMGLNAETLKPIN